MKILLVEDSKSMRNIQKRVLASLCQDFAEAADGVEALALIDAGGQYDLIVIDWNMPHMDGYQLVVRIRENDKITPLVMCTTEAEKSRVVEAIQAGVNHYIIKPFTPQGLMEKVTATLEKSTAAA